MGLPTGNIELYHCIRCSMVWNRVFDNTLMQYDSSYEETQGFSPTFQVFHQWLATYLFDQYALGGKSVIEIGCGKGEFLKLLADLGIGRGYGFDPSFDESRFSAVENLSFWKTFFPPKASPWIPTPKADFYLCKMTLEHIHQPRAFLEKLRTYIGDQDATLAIQVPALERIVNERAYWDVYYEHCNYFSTQSLSSLLELARFSVIETSMIFDNQYLNIVARTKNVEPTFDHRLNEDIHKFAITINKNLSNWSNLLVPAAKRASLLIWGAASKAVALLNAIPALKGDTKLIDVNPNKQGSYLPSTRLKIESPRDLQNQTFDIILVANPIYLDEINSKLAHLNINGRVVALT
ncbi:MAG: methyltransferase domain-containing protein [Desulfobacterales bacterium]|nr:methyltransferase domain-containing protein [Desulfobacterales bacterium]